MVSSVLRLRTRMASAGRPVQRIGHSVNSESARDAKAITDPSPLMAGVRLFPEASPLGPTLTRSIALGGPPTVRT